MCRNSSAGLNAKFRATHERNSAFNAGAACTARFRRARFHQRSRRGDRSCSRLFGNFGIVGFAWFTLWMWTTSSRGRMAAIEKKAKRYPRDLTDEGWSAVEAFSSAARSDGQSARNRFREVLNATRYLVRSGCEWRMLPKPRSPRPGWRSNLRRGDQALSARSRLPKSLGWPSVRAGRGMLSPLSCAAAARFSLGLQPNSARNAL
ncbi:Putative transposase of IS4/5 family [Bosea lathyri]|uniref:Putative transposase of IS4/5 family n=1 Tax=Bosea lathyri TaxID=1036778 RepID=A0A1H5YV76_9HYPH|nr:Putative transposase of IS4/5 family [Bosea lathyri]